MLQLVISSASLNLFFWNSPRESSRHCDRWGKPLRVKLRVILRVRRQQSRSARPPRWLARKIFFWPISGTEFEHFWNWGPVQAPFSIIPKSFRTRKAIAKSRSLWLQSWFFFHVFLIWTEVSFIQEVSGVYSSPFLDTDELKIALRARKVSRAFEKRAPGSVGIRGLSGLEVNFRPTSSRLGLRGCWCPSLILMSIILGCCWPHVLKRSIYGL